MPTFDTILVALDLTKNSLPALRKALELRTESVEVTCFHVVPESGEEARSYKQFYEEKTGTEKLMKNFALPWMENWLTDQEVSIPDDVELAATMGQPADEILKRARSGNYDLIVAGTHGRTGMDRYWMGSVAENVLRRSPCPVLVVRPEYPDVIED